MLRRVLFPLAGQRQGLHRQQHSVASHLFVAATRIYAFNNGSKREYLGKRLEPRR
jgi:hypothetical protein